ncbi:MAG: hypothetical protein ACK551_05870 [Vampirovibrionales bacterium]
MFANSLADVQLAKMIELLTLLLIPVGVLLALLLYKSLFLLQHALDFVNIARFDLVPLIQDLRAITSHTARLVEQVDSGVDLIQRSVGKVPSALNQAKSWGLSGLCGLKRWASNALNDWLDAPSSSAKASANKITPTEADVQPSSQKG